MIVPLFHWRVGRGSSVAVPCFNLIIYFCPTISVVCNLSLTSACDPWSVIYIAPIFPGTSDLLWYSSNFDGRADVCAGTTPDHCHSRISRWPRGQLWRSNLYGFNRLPGACAYIDWQWCIARDILGGANPHLGGRRLFFLISEIVVVLI